MNAILSVGGAPGNPGPRAWWLNYARAAILLRVGEEVRHAAAVEFVADYCAGQNERGLFTCVMHALAVYNALTVCHCAGCSP